MPPPMIGCFWILLALSGGLDLKKHWDIDRLVVGSVGRYPPTRLAMAWTARLYSEASADRARASRRTNSHNVLLCGRFWTKVRDRDDRLDHACRKTRGGERTGRYAI